MISKQGSKEKAFKNGNKEVSKQRHILKKIQLVCFG